MNIGLKLLAPRCRPGAPDSPDAVEKTRATALGHGRARVQCNPAPRADCHQVWIRTVATEPDFQLAESPQEPDEILEGLPAGQTAEIKMRAANETGPGPFGDSVQLAIVAEKTKTMRGYRLLGLSEDLDIRAP
ncbi:MAG: hypothetical protein HYY24_02170 [Verrucomicrobia bacterium]|nr:hypothetical protein [Verrucomicrobiota bacterium]